MKHKHLQVKDFKFDDSNRLIKGYASTFGNVDSYGDTVFPGAYKETLEERKRPVKMRWNHWGEIIGKWTVLQEDDKGLYVEGELTKGHAKAEDVYASLKHGSIDGLSIGYYATKSKKNETGGEDLLEIELIEISVVEDQADLHATIDSVKNFTALKDYERALRDVGFSQSQAKRFVSGIKNHREGDVTDLSLIDWEL
jgi:uncharacterized protein